MSIRNLRRIAKSKKGWDLEYYSGGRKNRKAGKDLFIIGRHWNSETPSVPRSNQSFDQELQIEGAIGGGYFLRLKGIGIAIDPGFSFLRYLFSRHGISIADIDVIIISHFHQDHCADIENIINLSRMFSGLNENTPKTPIILAPKPVCQMLDLFSNIIYHRILPGETWEIRRFFNLNEANYEPILSVKFLPALHWQNINNYTLQSSGYPTFIDYHLSAVGMYINLEPREEQGRNKFRRILITGDTLFPLYMTNHADFLQSIYDLYLSRDKMHINLGDVDPAHRQRHERILHRYFTNFLLAYRHYKIEPDLVCFHIGGIEKGFNKDQINIQTLHYDGHHLGILGIIRLFMLLNRQNLKCCVITEWGEELSGERKNITKLVEDTIHNIINRYKLYPDNKPSIKLPFIPSDIDLAIDLENGLVKCSEHNIYHSFEVMTCGENMKEYLRFCSKIAHPDLENYEQTCNWEV